MGKTKAFKEIVLTKESIIKMGLTPIERKKGACYCGKQDGVDRKRVWEVWGTIESKTSNSYAIWTNIELKESDKVQKKKTENTWNLCYMYIVEKSAFSSVLKELKEVYKESIKK